MKTIALIKKDFSSNGGLEKVTRKIKEALEKKAQVTLLTGAMCPSKKWLKFQRLQEFDRWCQEKSRGFDVVFSMDRCSYQTIHRAGNGVHAAYLDLRKGLFRRFNPLHQTILHLEKKTFEDPHVQHIIVNSHMVKDQILHYYATPAEKIVVIHNGVEWHEMENDFYASPFNNPRLELLFIGHNFERKGLAPLLRALSQLKRRDFHLSVVGTDKNISSYKRMAHHLPVTFYGAQDNTRPFYQKADVLVIPSQYDPFANVTVEALAMGLFVVTSPMNGGHEVLTPQTGVVGLENLETTFNHPKTKESAQRIRDSVRHLDYSIQLEKVCSLC